MKVFAFAALAAASLTVSAPASAQNARELLKGTAIGAGAGLVTGAVVPGLSTTEGALIGAAGGAAVTALTKNGRKCYRDRNGARYYLNSRGNRVYRRC